MYALYIIIKDQCLYTNSTHMSTIHTCIHTHDTLLHTYIYSTNIHVHAYVWYIFMAQ